MHGFIFSELQSYVTSKYGKVAWFSILEQAGLEAKEFANFLDYPDEELLGIVGVASRTTELPPSAIVEDFGVFLGADLMKIYRPLIDPGWRTLDFLLHAEETIHKVVRARNTQARPPALAFSRLGEDAVLLTYRSPRQMCSLSKGIARGVAGYYGEEISITDESCMLEGAEECRIRFALGPAPTPD